MFLFILWGKMWRFLKPKTEERSDHFATELIKTVSITIKNIMLTRVFSHIFVCCEEICENWILKAKFCYPKSCSIYLRIYGILKKIKILLPWNSKFSFKRTQVLLSKRLKKSSSEMFEIQSLNNWKLESAASTIYDAL